LIGISDLKYQLNARDPQELADAIAIIKKDGCIALDNRNGYDRQIFTVLGGSSSSKEEDGDEDEDDLDEDTRNIASAFTNNAFKRKQSRLIAAKFAQVVS
jgi:hypothetical protein